MPAESLKPPAKRGRPAFKPPRPAASKSAKAKTTARRKSASAPTLDSSENEPTADSPETSSEPDSESSDTVTPLSGTQDPPPVIPPNLLTRLLHHHLEKKEGGSTKIGKDANVLVGRYMETFVREAIARAAFERSQAEQETGMGDGFLEVEDLEKLAPQLLLDF
ncbi:MAG: hypothetical protein LQ343_006844 [Gyalolechia ehrenbergii]|nr:MAG: hypothetical protein LQ343_006844 [Gyalolechia ehrenbergii]